MFKLKSVLIISLSALTLINVSYANKRIAARYINVANSSSSAILTAYLGFNGQNYGCYTQNDFSKFCSFNTGNPYVCKFSVQKGTPVKIPFPKACQVSVAITVGQMPWGPCPTSLAEFTLNGSVGGKTQDTLDVSLVNGINYKMNIASSSAGSLINMTSAMSPYNTILGVYPLGCDGCAVSISPPTWANCPGKQPASNCQKGTQFNPNPGCQITRVPGSSLDSYTVTIVNS